MQAMKTGGLSGAPSRKKKKPIPEETTDDESDTEGEAADDTSDTNTDTDTGEE